MGLAAGGRVKGNVEKDEDPTVWNWKKARVLNVQILNSVAFEDVTGIIPPPSTIHLNDYIEAEIPIATFGNHPVQDALKSGSSTLAGLNIVADIDNQRGISTGITLKGNNLICCMICERNLCDSM